MKYVLRIVVFFGVVVLGVTGCHETWTKHFENVDAVKKQGLIDKGWVPRFIPQDSTDIVVTGDLDSGIALGSFVSMNSESVKSKCSGAPDSFPIPDYALHWLELGRAVAGNAAALRSRGYQVFECNAEDFNLAYLRAKNQFYYWTPHRK